MTKPIVFSEWVLEAIWLCIRASKRLIDTPHAPTKQAFLSQYTQVNPTPVFAWDDPVHGVTYQYDLRLNQVQLTPALKPYARAVVQLNNCLGEILPADLLSTDDNWEKAWFRAARHLDITSMRFLIDQGIDVDRVDENYSTALDYAVTPYGGSLEVVKLLVESGADLTHPANRVDLLIQAGLEGVMSSLEAIEARQIADYLNHMLMELRQV
ncbi:ankyrin repeat domain-containing protein [Spirosoma arboris]|nr:ankyrin repeat domain-containing protein [Spirosoma arboris]